MPTRLVDRDARMSDGVRLRLRALGGFHVLAPDGQELRFQMRKSAALLAMLALAPDKSCDRSWLRAKLWEDRGAEQQMASLRKCLQDLRAALDVAADCVHADRQRVWLDADAIEVDADNAQPDGEFVEGELLDGMELPYAPAFNAWLEDQRRRWLNAAVPQIRAPAPRPASGGLKSGKANGRLFLATGQSSADLQTMLRLHGVTDAVAKNLRELWFVDVIDRRSPGLEPSGLLDDEGGPGDLSLTAQAAQAGDWAAYRFVLSQVSGGGLLASWPLEQPAGADDDDARQERLGLINQVALIAGQFLGGRDGAGELCDRGIAALYRMGAANFNAADGYFRLAYEAEPRGLYLAWRAFLRTFLLAERVATDRLACIEEANAFKRQALEQEPLNSFVLSLCAHVEILVNRHYVAAFELAEKSIELNAANPIGWSTFGIAKGHLGKPVEGLRDVSFGRRIGGPAPYRFQLDSWGTVAAVMAHDYDAALRFAQASHAQAENFAPPMRYLAAIYSFHGQDDEAERIVDKLRAQEPDFSLATLLDKDYPSAGLRKSRLLSRIPGRQI